MNFPTGIQEYDVQALLAMDDHVLGITCSSSPYFIDFAVTIIFGY